MAKNIIIYDQFGRPVETQGLRPAKRKLAVASIRDRWWSYPSSGLTPEKLARIFREADEGYVLRQAELFEEVLEKDGHIQAEVSKRENALLTVDYEIKPFSDDKRDIDVANFVKEVIEKEIDFDDVIECLKTAVPRGFASAEIMWDVSEGQAVPKEIKSVEQKKFIWPWNEYYPKLVTDDEPNGVEIPPFKFLFHTYCPVTGHPNRAPILRVCCWMFLFKHYSIKDWVAFSEVYGMPLRLGKYDVNATDEDKEALKQAIQQLGSDAAGIISKSTEIDFIEALKQATVDVYDRLIKLANTEISKAVLGQTLSAEVGDKGSYAAAKVHNEVRLDLLSADATALAKTIRKQLFVPLVGFNFGWDVPAPYIEFVVEEPEDKEKEVNVVSTLYKDVGVPMSKSWIYDKFNIPPPKDEKDTLIPMIMPKAFKAKTKTEQRQYTSDQQAIEGLIENVVSQANEVMGQVIDPIIKIVMQSGSYEEIQEKIMTIFSELYTPAELQELLARAMFIADLFGRFSAK